LPFFTRPLSIILALLVVYTFVANVPSVNAAVKGGWSWLLDRVLPRRRGAKRSA